MTRHQLLQTTDTMNQCIMLMFEMTLARVIDILALLHQRMYKLL